jgi:hypothetical protein
MISCSAAYKAKINNGDVPLMRMQLISANGRTIWLEDGQFWGNSISFSHATSQDGAFTVGSATKPLNWSKSWPFLFLLIYLV